MDTIMELGIAPHKIRSNYNCKHTSRNGLGTVGEGPNLNVAAGNRFTHYRR
jgi:hypothetical protein